MKHKAAEFTISRQTYHTVDPSEAVNQFGYVTTDAVQRSVTYTTSNIKHRVVSTYYIVPSSIFTSIDPSLCIVSSAILLNHDQYKTVQAIAYTCHLRQYPHMDGIAQSLGGKSYLCGFMKCL